MASEDLDPASPIMCPSPPSVFGVGLDNFVLDGGLASPLLPCKRPSVPSMSSDDEEDDPPASFADKTTQADISAPKPVARVLLSEPLFPRELLERTQNQFLSPEAKAARLGPYKSSAAAENAAKKAWGTGWIVFATHTRSVHVNLPPIWSALRWPWAYKHAQGFDPEKCNELEKEYHVPTCRNCMANYTLCRIRYAPYPFWQPFCQRCAHLMAPKVPYLKQTFATETYDTFTGHAYVCNNCE